MPASDTASPGSAATDFVSGLSSFAKEAEIRQASSTMVAIPAMKGM